MVRGAVVKNVGHEFYTETALSRTPYVGGPILIVEAPFTSARSRLENATHPSALLGRYLKSQYSHSITLRKPNFVPPQR